MAEEGGRDPTRRSLFGGAMSIVLPAGFADVSDFRPVPDHQEVFADVDADASVVVEVMEPPDSDRVGTYYFHDIAEASDAEIDGAAVEEGFFPNADLAPAAVDFEFFSARGEFQVAKFREQAKNRVLVSIGVFRLPAQNSDVVITLNQPVEIDQASSSHKSAQQVVEEGARQSAEATFRAAVQSLRIEDMGLFGDDA